MLLNGAIVHFHLYGALENSFILTCICMWSIYKLIS